MKSLLGGQARSLIRGLIKIDKAASGANGFFTHNSLLLSKTAHVESSPTLEIETNMVKASHAATSGNLDRETLFYLGCRGIAENEAKRLVMISFACEYLTEIADEKIRLETEKLLTARINEIL